MPSYLFKCECGEAVCRSEKTPPENVSCPRCTQQMKRDYMGEGATSTFHVSRDLYAEKKGQKAY
jgi:hypothetical protein